MKYQFVETFPHPLLDRQASPCVSIYLPTHRTIHNQAKDTITYHHLIKEIKQSLQKLPVTPGIKDLIVTLEAIKDDQTFWQHSLDGLAIFASDESIMIYRTHESFSPLAIVADSFHIKPLYAYFQHHETFHFLALEAHRFRVYQGTMFHLELLAFPEGSPVTLEDVLGTQLTENYQTPGSYGGSFVGSTFHGHGGKKDAIEIDREKYFRYVDRFVYDHYSKLNPLPLIVVSLKEHQFLFKTVAKNPYLIQTMIDGSFESFSPSTLREHIQQLVEQRFLNQVHYVINQYQHNKNKHLSSDDLDLIGKALIEGRVDSLLLESDHLIPGHLNVNNQEVHPWHIEEPHTDDVLDDMLQLALKQGSKVIVIDKKLMPTTHGIAANFRY
jgi:hypothetical protein